MKRLYAAWVLGVAMAGCGATGALADVSYVTDTTAVQLTSGATVTVRVSLQLSGPELAWVNGGGAGLALGAVRLVRESGNATIASADAVAPNAAAFNEIVPGWAQVKYVSGANVGLMEGVSFNPMPPHGVYADGAGQVYLGSFQFTAPSMSDVSTFRVTRFDQNTTMIDTLNPTSPGLPLDPPSGAAGPTITITTEGTVVPVPGALWAALPVLGGLGYWRLRRKGAR